MWKVHVLVGDREVAVHDLAVGAEAIVGRDPGEADVVVAERSVSRRHCRLVCGPQGIEIEDLHSANGIYLSGKQVRSGTLKASDEAQIGMARIRVSRSAAQTGMIPIEGRLFDTTKESSPPITTTADQERSVIEVSRTAYRGMEKERLGILIETGKSLASTLDLDVILERIMHHLFEILPVKRGVLALLEEDGRLVARCVRPATELHELSAYGSQQIIRQVMQSGKPRIIEDASLMESLSRAQSILASNIRAAICAPLMSGTRCLGALYADYPGHARLYTPSDLEFIGAFAAIAAVSIENSRMMMQLKERERLQRDLELAAEIQKGLLPTPDFACPGIEIDWFYWPSKFVGGDFYDCALVEGSKLAVVLGDVSGKSIGAALFMSRLMSLLRATMPENPSPGAVLTRTNALLGSRADQVVFATACYLLVDPATRQLRYASAGHLPALILEPGSDAFRELPPTGIPLGVEEKTRYEGRDAELAPGAFVVLYTDGIVEARDAAGRMFGSDAMRRIVLEHRQETPKAISDALYAAVESHCRGSPHVRDDIALVIIRLEG